jgi:hypothetical protein
MARFSSDIKDKKKKKKKNICFKFHSITESAAIACLFDATSPGFFLVAQVIG